MSRNYWVSFWIVLAVSASSVFGQQTYQNLLPLSVGNKWTFVLSGQNPDTNPTRYEWEIKGSQQVGEVTFYTFDRPLPCVEVTRIGIHPDGKVLAIDQNSVVTLFDFEMPPDQVYYFLRSYSGFTSPINFHVYTYRNQFMSSGPFKGRTVTSLRFDDPAWLDEAGWFSFLPNVGFVGMGCGWSSMQLISANISGSFVTRSERHDTQPEVFTIVNAFPNPFQNELNVEFGSNGSSTIELFDILGRRAIPLRTSQCFSASCSELLETDALPTGTYLLKITNPNHLQRTKIVFKK